MRQKTRCVSFVEMQRAFLTLRLNEGQQLQLRNEMQDQLLEQFLCFGHIIRYSQVTPHIVFLVRSTHFRCLSRGSFLKVSLN